MRHTRTLLLATATLFPACPKDPPVEGTSDATTSGTEGASSSETTRSPDTTSDTPTSGVPTSTGNTTNETTTAATATDTTATEPAATTSTATTSAATTSQDTDTDTDTDTTGDYGLCGWKPSPANYYACEKDGGKPGMTNREHPIDCPPNVMKGDPCTEDGEVNNYGCCTPEGVLYYCEITESFEVIEIDCGM